MLCRAGHRWRSYQSPMFRRCEGDKARRWSGVADADRRGPHAQHVGAVADQPAPTRVGRGEVPRFDFAAPAAGERSEEHTSELQSLMRISYAVFCLTKKQHHINI